MSLNHRVSRRSLVGVVTLFVLGGAGSALLASCGQPAASSPTAAASTGAAPAPAAPPTPTTVPPAAPTAVPTIAPTATAQPAPKATTAPASAQKVPLSVYYWANDATDLAIWKEQIAAVMQRQPQLDVKFDTETFANYHDKLLTQAGAGTLADVIMDNGFRVSSLAARGVTRSLKPFIDKENFDLKDFVPPSLDMGSFKGEVHCLFYDFVGLLPFYNVDMFDQAGVPHPDQSWSWDEFIANMKKLTTVGSDGRVQQGGFQLNKDFVWGVSPFIFQNGGQLWDKDQTTTLLDSPESLAAIDYYAALRNKQKVTLTDLSDLSNDADPFLAKKLAWDHLVVASASGIGPDKGVNWDWGVMPHQNGKKPVTWAAGSGWAVSGKPKQPDAAWTFVKEITSSASLSVLAQKQRAYPARISAMPAYFQGRPKHVEYSKSVMDYAIAYPQHASFLEWWDILNRELEPVLLGTASSADTIKRIKPGLDKLLTQARQLSAG